ncbi:hypothetical protein [Microcoleus sp.]|uniref:hypothetical protein n=1 Tax=Microcoleus sp. TaxID=44472 RepID=UPI00403E923E
MPRVGYSDGGDSANTVNSENSELREKLLHLIKQHGQAVWDVVKEPTEIGMLKAIFREQTANDSPSEIARDRESQRASELHEILRDNEASERYEKSKESGEVVT